MSSPNASIRRLFAIDLRSLAACRIFLAAILLVDLAIRATDFTAMYTAEGIMPIELVRDFYRERGTWHGSLYWFHPSPVYQGGLLMVAALAAIALLLGYRTRLATIASWLLLLSLHNRAPLVTNAGDTLLRLLLFWAMFLPWGQAWSLDARRTKAITPAPQGAFSAASAAILLQVCLMYWLTALFKIEAGWLDGAGLADSLAFESYQRPLAAALLAYPRLCEMLTYATVALELIGPLLVWLPWQTARIRLAVIAAFVALHVGIEATLYVGLFSWVSFAAWTLFLPFRFWDGITSRIRGARRESASGAKRGLAPSPATVGTTDRSPAKVPVPVSRVPVSRAMQIAINLICALAFLYVVLWNVDTWVRRITRPDASGAAVTSETEDSFQRAENKLGTPFRVMPRWLQHPGEALMIRQNWAMFSRPAQFDGWFLGRATLKNGRKIDLLRNGTSISGDIASHRPRPISAMFPNHRWRKFYNSLRSERFASFRQPTAEYLCRLWQREHQGKPEADILLFELLLVREPMHGQALGEIVVTDTLARLEFGSVEEMLDFELPY